MGRAGRGTGVVKTNVGPCRPKCYIIGPSTHPWRPGRGRDHGPRWRDEMGGSEGEWDWGVEVDLCHEKCKGGAGR